MRHRVVFEMKVERMSDDYMKPRYYWRAGQILFHGWVGICRFEALTTVRGLRRALRVDANEPESADAIFRGLGIER